MSKMEQTNQIERQENIEYKTERIPYPEEMVKKFKELGYKEHAEAYRKILEISQSVKKEGGKVFLVGGSVRDIFFNKMPKDFDLEIYRLEAEKIREIVGKVGRISEVGKSFGVLKVFLDNGMDIDVSLPRTDSKIGEGHRGFEVKTDPYMSVKDACRRRDFTMNSMLADVVTGVVTDPFNGLEDIENKVLRVTDPEKFIDDPVRVERAPQFVGRFGLTIEEKSLKLMRKMVPDLKKEPKSRIIEEWKKLLLKSDKPSLGLMAAMSIGIFKELHPEFLSLQKTPQDEEWHPEGDVWMHTLMAVDEAAKLCREYDLDKETAFTVMLSSLCHDLGKQSTTKLMKKDGKMQITFYGHEQAGKEPTERFLSSIGVDNLTRSKVAKLVANHLIPSMWFIDSTVRGQEISNGAFNRLAAKIHPATMRELALTAAADYRGRGPFVNPETPDQLMMPKSFPAGQWFIERARELGMEKSKPSDLIRGKDLFCFGFKNPGPLWGEIIKLSSDLRDSKNFTKDMFFRALYGVSDEKEAVAKLKLLLSETKSCAVQE